MKKLIGAACTLLIVIVATVVGRKVGSLAVETSTIPSFEEKLVQVASKLNERFPIMLDKDTRIDTTVAGPGRTFTYFYTFPSHASDDFDPEALHAALEPAVRQSECGIPQMRELFQAGVTAYFVYRGNDGVEITRTSVSPSDCGI
jgi:hypothetical protein